MQFRFDANQEHQLRAVESTVRLLDGQTRVEARIEFSLGGTVAAVPNRLELTDEALLVNLQLVQRDGAIEVSSELLCIEGEIAGSNGSRQVRFANFSVEMETGTGKTYVYLRTAMELYQRYGLRKFIVVVPSVAVREGVLKTLSITEKHLRELHGNPPYHYVAYDSANLAQVRQFAMSDGIEVMVMTIDAFNKASNVIRQSTDRLQGETPIHLVQATRPVLILDEPQNMESELRIKALASLDPLFALRYSATHRNPYNLVYRLTPFEAYRQGLVKRIEVAGVEEEINANRVFVRLDGVRTERNTLTARVAVHALTAGGTVKEKVVTVRSGDSLQSAARRPDYAPFVVEEINAGDGFVRFANGVELRIGEARGADKRAIFEAQIRYTLEEHFRKQQRLKDHGIKVLSLFFIDRVDHYTAAGGIIRELFLKALSDVTARHPEWKDGDAAKLHGGYFASHRARGGEVIYEDSKTGESEKDREVYDLIMRDKERLLSFDEPLCFVFSHSALREGWDSPNVFQICTLNQTVSELKKRQEIGRGVRLAVNQAGERVHDERINVLTVVANESYEQYVGRLQAEVEDEVGSAAAAPKPANARRRAVAKLRKQFLLREEFRELWERIKHKTRYAVTIDTAKLIRQVADELDRAEIHAPRLRIEKARVDVDSQGSAFTPVRVAEGFREYGPQDGGLPNVLAVMAHVLEATSPPVRLTRRTLLGIATGTCRRDSMLVNPHEFALVAARIIKQKLVRQLVDGIRYERINEWYEMTQFEAEIESWEEYLVPAARSLYDHVIFDSEVEKRFAEELDRRDDVKLFVKLPSWFTVDTPLGKYNPDWAVVLEPRDEHGRPTGEQLLYLVRETKDTVDLGNLRPDEADKIRCGEQHFEGALRVDFKVLTSSDEVR